ncbi:MAG: hypothetical protein NTU97_00775 [Candidatus Magasanikbacteria bacterium]|nr:hypothetical protein [Candidatus Magasanikbacteria bacterium]
MAETQLENQLEKLGLHKNEIKIYLSLFELGKVKAGQIIEHTGLHRNLVYTALETLVEKNLVSKVERAGIFVFAANSPELLQEMIEAQSVLASEVVAELKKRQEEKPRDIIIYEGEEGLKRSRNHVLTYDPGDTLFVIGSKASSTPEMERYWRKFHQKRINKKIGLKIMYERGVDPEDIAWRNSLPMSQAKYLPIDIDLPVWFSAIKDYLEIGIPGDPLLTFGLKSKGAAGAIQKFFEYFWNQQVSTETGLPALKNAIYNMLNELEPGEEYFVLGASVGGGDEQVQKLYDNFHADRIKKGVVVNMLAFKEGFQKIMDRFSYCGDPMGKVSHAKAFMSAPPTPMQINIFKNKVFFIIYGSKPTVISFDQPEISQVFKNYFEEMWNQETQILKGAEALKDLWLEAIEAKELRWVGARGYFMDNYPELFKEIKAKAEKTPGIVWKNVMDLGFKGHLLTRLQWSQTRYNLSGARNPIVIWLFGDKVLIVNWAEKVPIIFLSTNKSLVQSYSDYFDELWNKK